VKLLENFLKLSYSQPTSHAVQLFVLAFTVKESQVCVVFLIWIQTWDLERESTFSSTQLISECESGQHAFLISRDSWVPKTPLKEFHANDLVIALGLRAQWSLVRRRRALRRSCNCRRILVWFSQLREMTAGRHLENPALVCRLFIKQAALCLCKYHVWRGFCSEFRKYYLHLKESVRKPDRCKSTLLTINEGDWDPRRLPSDLATVNSLLAPNKNTCILKSRRSRQQPKRPQFVK